MADRIVVVEAETYEGTWSYSEVIPEDVWAPEDARSYIRNLVKAKALARYWELFTPEVSVSDHEWSWSKFPATNGPVDG